MGLEIGPLRALGWVLLVTCTARRPSGPLHLTGTRGIEKNRKKKKRGRRRMDPIRRPCCQTPLCVPDGLSLSRLTFQRRPGAFPLVYLLIAPNPLFFPHNHGRHPRHHPQKLRPEDPLPRGSRIPGRYHGWNLRMLSTFFSPRLQNLHTPALVDHRPCFQRPPAKQ